METHTTTVVKCVEKRRKEADSIFLKLGWLQSTIRKETQRRVATEMGEAAKCRLMETQMLLFWVLV